MLNVQTIERRWTDDHLCVVAATGPSLTPDVVEHCRGHDVIAVNDAFKLMPWAVALYACDSAWWKFHRGCPEFKGEKWSSHGPHRSNDKSEVASRYGLRLVSGHHADSFSTDPARISFGSNSGFQAINLAILFGAKRIVLVGFDMSIKKGMSHFFGDHPHPLKNVVGNYQRFIQFFDKAAKTLPSDIRIVNATSDSALKCFPMVGLTEALSERRAA